MDELLQPLAGRMLLELDGVDLFPLARAGEVAAVDPGADRSRVSLPVYVLDVRCLRLILARRWICERVVEPTSPKLFTMRCPSLKKSLPKASTSGANGASSLEGSGGKTTNRSTSATKT